MAFDMADYLAFASRFFDAGPHGVIVFLAASVVTLAVVAIASMYRLVRLVLAGRKR